ncbi:MAG: ankyrin repeat domain-containing protein [Spirochaetia bacterium]|uniref:ankyrin repeat domain-containing protein n=1 Tax=Candidatus Avelusimicrobium fimicolum TaxID=3416216 RepID=UPI003CA95267|nr:ankyrin repeat domain-containing protein [Spirochaetia bacterium]
MRKFLLLALLGMSAVIARAGVLGAAFFAVVRSGDTDKAEEMLRADKTLVFVEEPDGTTAFLAAVKNKDVKMARLLADSFSRLDVRTNGGNALHLAVSNNDEEMLRMLFAFMDEVEPELFESLANEPRGSRISPASDRNTPLHLAALNCNRAIYGFLATHGANEKILNRRRQTPRSLVTSCKQTPETVSPVSEVTVSQPKTQK